MSVLQIYRRVLGLLAGDRRLAIVLGLANVLVAGLQVLDPVLFGRVVGLLSASDRLPHDQFASVDVQAGVLKRSDATVAARNFLNPEHCSTRFPDRLPPRCDPTLFPPVCPRRSSPRDGAR